MALEGSLLQEPGRLDSVGLGLLRPGTRDPTRTPHVSQLSEYGREVDPD